MCEVAILSTEKNSVEEIAHAGMTLFKSMRTSLGVVSIEHTPGKYEYDVYKSVDPDIEHVEDFVAKRHDDAVRFILHGRLATHGTHDIEGAHPIQVECDKCDIDYVVHNGIVRGHDKLQQRAEAEGHNFRTDVDTEAIVHRYGETPADIDGIREEFEHQPCYILMQEDKLLIHAGRRYNLTEDGRMARGHREFGPDSGKYKDLIMTPAKQTPEVPA